MNKQELIHHILKNRYTKREAVDLIADFLVMDRAHAVILYEVEIEPHQEPASRGSKGGKCGTPLTGGQEEEIRKLHSEGMPKCRLMEAYRISNARLNDILNFEVDMPEPVVDNRGRFYVLLSDRSKSTADFMEFVRFTFDNSAHSHVWESQARDDFNYHFDKIPEYMAEILQSMHNGLASDMANAYVNMNRMQEKLKGLV